MADLGRAVMTLDADSKGFDTKVDAAEKKAGGLGKAIGGVSATTRIMTGVMAGSAAGALSQWAQAAADDEASTLRLAQAIENSGTSFDEASAAIEERIKQGQALAFSDDETRESMTLLVAATGSVDEAMKRNALAMDLARGTGMSLQAASKLLGKVTDENVNVLKRYGITVAEGAGETELFAEVQKRFGGQAETYGNTTKASIDKVKDSIGEWQESIGAALGPAGQYIALLPGMTAGMQIVGGAFGALLPKIIAVTASMWSMIPAVVAALVPFWPIIAVAAAVGAAILALKFAWENNLGDIQGKTQAVLGFVTGLWETFSSFFVGLWQSIGGPVSAAVAAITAPISGLIGLVQGAIALLGQLGAQRAAADAYRAPSVISNYQAQQSALGNIDVSGGMTANVYLDGRQIATAVGDRMNERRRVGGAMA